MRRMSSSKPRKACSNCYQKKVRCDWKVDSQRCTFCTDHELDCSIPEANKPVQRTSIRDTLRDFEARLHRLESQSAPPAEAPRDGGSNPMVVSSLNTSVEEELSSDARNWAARESQSFELQGGLEPQRGSLEWNSSRPAYFESEPASDDDLYAATPDSRNLTGDPLIASASDFDPEAINKPQFVQAYRGSISPWNMLNEGMKTFSPSTASSPFNVTMIRLADEERSTFLKSTRIQWNLLRELPHLTPELVFTYAKDYGVDAPFPIIYWPSLEQSIKLGLATSSWSRWGEIVCVLLYLAFGSAHLNVSSPEPEGEIYFQRAWGMLPQILLEQDLWSVKALTLMVHYLQAGSLPEPCYALIGSASRMAISLGFHTYSVQNNRLNVIEDEEGRRAWWLCYIMEKTLSVILGRPSINPDKPDADLPQPYKTPSHPDFNVYGDLEAVNLYCDIIETIRSREMTLQNPPPQLLASESSEGVANARRKLVTSIVDQLRAKSRLKRPLDFKYATSISLRAAICDLCYYNSIIVLSRHLDPDTVSPESVNAARISIRLISENHATGMIMCLWMWLYYGFSATIPLLLSVLQNPLSSSAPLNMALISDIETVCKSLASSSLGAKRIMEVTSLMGKVGFEAIKSRAKRKADEEVDDTMAKRAELEPDVEVTDNTRSGSGQPDNMRSPENFSWDEWDQWLTNSIPSPS